MNTLSLKTIFKEAWSLCAKHWLVIIGLYLSYTILGVALTFVTDALPDKGIVISLFLQIFVAYLLTAILLQNYRGEEANFKTLNLSVKSYFKFFGAYILFSVAVMSCLMIFLVPSLVLALQWETFFVSLIQKPVLSNIDILYIVGVMVWIILLLIPGLFLALRWQMIYFILIEEPKQSIINAFRLSWRMTAGYTGKLFLIVLASMGFLILGLLALIVGVIYAQTFLMFITVVTYGTLRSRYESKLSMTELEA